MKQRRSYLLDDGPRSLVRGEDLFEIRRRYMIPPSVGIRNPSEFERAPDGGVNEVAIYEAYLEDGMRSGVPSIVSEVFSYFGFCPSQLTPLSWRTLMAIQVLGELRGFHIGVHEVLYSYCFSPLASKPGFYFLRSHDGAPLVGEPSRGAGGNYHLGGEWDNRYVFLKFQEPIRYPTFWRIVDMSRPVSFAGEAVAKLVINIPLQFRWVSFLGSKEALRHSRLRGNVLVLPISAIFRSYQGVKTRRKRSSRALPPRLVRAADFVSGPPPLPSVDVGAGINHSFPGDAHQKLFSEVLSLRGQVQDMMVRRDRLVQQVRVAARWELMKECLEERTGGWNPGKEYRSYLSLFGRPSVESGRPTTPVSTGSRVSAGLPF
ncbi:hypothetical protein Bca101_082895 [Brassica carinata]